MVAVKAVSFSAVENLGDGESMRELNAGARDFVVADLEDLGMRRSGRGLVGGFLEGQKEGRATSKVGCHSNCVSRGTCHAVTS